jgi:hypothetical protein
VISFSFLHLQIWHASTFTHSLCEVFTLECLFTKTWENCQSNKEHNHSLLDPILLVPNSSSWRKGLLKALQAQSVSVFSFILDSFIVEKHSFFFIWRYKISKRPIKWHLFIILYWSVELKMGSIREKSYRGDKRKQV